MILTPRTTPTAPWALGCSGEKSASGIFLYISKNRVGKTAAKSLKPRLVKSAVFTKSASGVRYYGFRYYNPNTGRWISRDPIEEQGGLNLYGMVGNDSLNRLDLLGLKIQGRWSPNGIKGSIDVEIYYTNADTDCPGGIIKFVQSVRSGGFNVTMEYGTLWRQILGLNGGSDWDYDTIDGKKGYYPYETPVVAPNPSKGKSEIYPGMSDSPKALDETQMEFVTVAHCVCSKGEREGRKPALGQISWGFSYRGKKTFVWGLRKGS